MAVGRSRTIVIIGNPPFLGAKRLKPEHGPDYVNAIRRLYPEVPGMADFCVYWFNRANHHLPVCTPERPERGRAGLVGTQNIRNNKSREGGLDHIVRTGTIVEAVDNQPWSGEANVHVSIANWVKHSPVPERAAGLIPAVPTPAGIKPAARKKSPAKINDPALLIPAKRKLWFKVEPAPGLKKPKRRGSGPANKEYEIEFRESARINASLSDAVDVSVALRLAANTNPQRSFVGQMPGYLGYVLKPKDAEALIRANVRNKEVVHPYLIGREVVSGTGAPERFIIDFTAHDLFSAKSHQEPFAWLERHVLDDVRNKLRHSQAGNRDMEDARKAHLDQWWQMWSPKPTLLAWLSSVNRYLLCSRVTKRPIFVFASSDIRPGDKLQVFAFDDDYSFGVLQSSCHWSWFFARCAKLTERLSYSGKSVFDTFPWPQSPANKLVTAVAAAGREVRRVRDDALTRVSGGLRAVYRTLELPGKNPLKEAHATLDAAVLAAYGFNPKKDLLAQLLDLNLAVAASIDRNEPVTSPGIPPKYPKPDTLITGDAIRPT